jgi:hypothetical protein
MSDQQSLSDVLSGKESAPVVETTGENTAPPAVETKPVETKAEKVETADRARDESGKFTTTEAKADEPAQTKPRPDVAAIIDERRKRQALEKQLAELTAQKPAAKVSVFDNEDEAIRSRVDEATRPLREAHYNLSMRYARQLHGESFSDAETSFMEAAESNPGLYEGLRSAADPGEYVYLHGTFHREMSEVGGNILAYRDKVTADSASKLKEAETQVAALKAQVEALTKAKADIEQIPTSLNSRASVAATNGVPSDESLGSLVRFSTKQR